MSREDIQLEWKNWAQYINNTTMLLDQLGEISNKAYFDIEYINLFFSKLKTFSITRKPYIIDYTYIEKELDKVGDVIFSSNYLNDLRDKKKSPKIISLQYKVMKRLNNIFSKIVESLSMNQIIPKTTKVDNHTPGAVKFGGN